jgi:hypothetical protein
MAEGRQREPNTLPLPSADLTFFDTGFYDDRYKANEFHTFQNINNIGE